MKILIVEDDPVRRKFLYNFFSRYGECDLVINEQEILDAFLLALKDNEPYKLICIDIKMLKADSANTIKAIRDLKKQHGIALEDSAKIIVITSTDEAKFVQAAFDCHCEAQDIMTVNTKKMEEALEKLELIEDDSDVDSRDEHQCLDFEKDIIKHSMQKYDLSSTPFEENIRKNRYFKNVQALPEYQIEVTMETDTIIHFDFRSRLNTVRFSKLRDEELFKSLQTDGNYLIFYKAGRVPVKITASEFMDLVLVDRRK
ncbi:MAG: hypothetical protein E6600_17725 [Anaerocolumna aminovalerica]|jgi:two-component system chemotaxis response regulator CheY|uniref:hypothetical protein n=1 Tax=Anaerocolumna aminovalerica TaxID=1527 RepID=UPI002915ABC1|nr:hypothetical protein [Anaerocolumna aminovalerica]MDU6266337.1 hypothetical protein [Anaerocolumna aminovalerica]